MSNVIQFPEVEFETCCYQEDDNGKLVGVTDRELDMSCGVVSSDSSEEVFISVNGEGLTMDRERLARFLWIATRFIDGAERFHEDEYVGLNYDSTDN